MATKKTTTKAEDKAEESTEPTAAEKAAEKAEKQAAKKAALYEGSEHWPEFRNVTYVRALQQEDGSYLIAGSKGDEWQVSEHDFHNSYMPTTPNKS